ncbi:hypothetical protein [Bacillus nitratireducens]|nr:hypothetical protein [Bacillus nitratireducens]
MNKGVILGERGVKGRDGENRMIGLEEGEGIGGDGIEVDVDL